MPFMKPKELLTRLKQDLRKLLMSESPEDYSRYQHFAKKKLKPLRTYHREGQLDKTDTKNLNDCLTLLSDAIKVHDGKK